MDPDCTLDPGGSSVLCRTGIQDLQIPGYGATDAAGQFIWGRLGPTCPATDTQISGAGRDCRYGGDLLGGKSTGALFTKVLQSRTVEDELVKRFDLRKHYHKKYWEDARSKLEINTSIVEDKKSGVLAITVKDRDPQFAATLAAAYVDALDHVMSQVSTSAARRERIFIEQRLAEEKAALDDAEEKFSRFSSSTMALDVPEQTRVMVEASARLQGELIAARSELEGLQQVYTPENTRVKTLQARVNELERSLAKINTGSPKGGASATDPIPPSRTCRWSVFSGQISIAAPRFMKPFTNCCDNNMRLHASRKPERFRR